MHLVGAGDPAANWVAKRQHGLIARHQAVICGLGRGAVAGRCRRGIWVPLRRGVYLLGTQEPSDCARVLAGVLSCSPGAVASHCTAGWLLDLIDRLEVPFDILLLDGRNPGGEPDVRVHRPRVHGPGAIRWRHGIPVTSPTDTLLDLAGVLPIDALEAACALALSKDLVSRERLISAVNDSPPRPGIGQLRSLMSSGPALTRSGNERLMRGLVQRAGLPEPSLNATIWGKEFDLYWPEAKLAVEIDAFGTHGAPAPFEADRRLDADFAAAGIEVLRFTGRRIRAEPLAVVARLAATLALRLGGLPPSRRR